VSEAAVARARSDDRVPDGAAQWEARDPVSAREADAVHGVSHPVEVSRPVETSPRRTDVALLRIALCAAIILLHALSIFSAEPIYHLKSALPSTAASVLAEFLRITAVPLFFVLAGWSAMASLRARSPGDFVRERVSRLLVPLCVGSALFGSAIKYIELSHGRDIGFHGFRLAHPLHSGFFAFFPHNLMRINQMTWSHLWFLAYLFLISMLLLPLAMRLARTIPRIDVPAAPVVYVPALVMAALLAVFNGYWPYLPNLYTDWTNFAYFALCFALGVGLAAWPGFEARLHAETPRLVLLTLVAYAGVVLCGQTMAGRALVALTAWGAIGTALGVAGRIKLRPSPAFDYLGEATLPVFVLHHLPALLLGVALLPLALPAWLKIAVIWLAAGAVSLAAYHWLIRPWPPMRWSMGLDAAPPSRRRCGQ